MTPSVEHTFNGTDHILQLGEVSVMTSFSPRNLPNALNRIEFRLYPGLMPGSLRPRTFPQRGAQWGVTVNKQRFELRI